MILETEVSECLHPISGSHRLHSCNAKKYMINCRLETNQTIKIISNISVSKCMKRSSHGRVLFEWVCLGLFPTIAGLLHQRVSHMCSHNHWCTNTFSNFFTSNIYRSQLSQRFTTMPHLSTQNDLWLCSQMGRPRASLTLQKKTLKAWTDSSNPKKQLATSKCS